MSDDALDSVLRLVAAGRLTAEEAGPILDALDVQRSAPSTRDQGPAEDPATSLPGGPGRAIRVEVTEAGRKVVNLRVPIALGRAALSRIPGVSEATTERLREAIEAGVRGPILDIDDEGDGVRIVVE